MAGIYIHIPFCKKACHYCNFHFSTGKALQKEFVEALLKEIDLQTNYIKEPVSTIYFGGGTPSLLPTGDIERIMLKLREVFHVENGAEITLESNPDDIATDKLKEWKSIGINRLSMGVQSFFEEDLQWMNRAHNASQAEQSVRLAQAAGFDNLTIDLIYGTPTLTDEHWLQNIQKAIELDIPHLSCYALTVEPRTALEKLIEKKQLENVDPDKQARHFEQLVERTQQAGFEHYEISNFAKPGYRSRHNSSYWQGKPYLGLGPSAHSFDGTSRQWNIANNALYIKQLSQDIVPFEKEVLTETDRLNEYIMTSLRTIEGLSLKMVEENFGKGKADTVIAAAKKHIDNQKLSLLQGKLIVTNEGKFFADGIAADLFQ